jgi:uncharacterized protein (DUF1684 family)
MNELDEFRVAKDDFFKNDPHSPLTADQRGVFVGLNYFPGNAALRLEVEAKAEVEHRRVEMPTSTGDAQSYSAVGRIRFDVDGQPAELTIFQGANGLFLPFVDSLAGSETYPAGRYLEPELLPGGRYLVDFNYAYNPYCAYNTQWSCPLTPFENRLKVPIRAGEKLFLEQH